MFVKYQEKRRPGLGLSTGIWNRKKTDNTMLRHHTQAQTACWPTWNLHPRELLKTSINVLVPVALNLTVRSLDEYWLRTPCIAHGKSQPCAWEFQPQILPNSISTRKCFRNRYCSSMTNIQGNQWQIPQFCYQLHSSIKPGEVVQLKRTVTYNSPPQWVKF